MFVKPPPQANRQVPLGAAWPIRTGLDRLFRSKMPLLPELTGPSSNRLCRPTNRSLQANSGGRLRVKLQQGVRNCVADRLIFSGALQHPNQLRNGSFGLPFKMHQ
jgi:hypothetical protein